MCEDVGRGVVFIGTIHYPPARRHRGRRIRRPARRAAPGWQPVRVTLVDRCNHHVFQPLLYQPDRMASLIASNTRGRS
jgi:hypothetical protein